MTRPCTTIHAAATADHIRGLQDDLAAARAENTLLRKQLADVMEVVRSLDALDSRNNLT